jgi:(E)-4-hydroxy-3-methylbut-2-enyl-diphosphate synthase
MDFTLPVIQPAVDTGLTPEKHPTYKVGVRRMTRKVSVGGVPVGGGSPISVQTMTKTKTSDVAGTVQQIRQAAEAGCDIVRVTVNEIGRAHV